MEIPQVSERAIYSIKRVTLPNGRMVDCMVYDGYNAGGVSCDWGQG